jgi:hypothetical protein
MSDERELEAVSGESAPGPFGFVAMVLASAVSVGLLVITTTVFLVDALRSGQPPASLDLSFYILVGGTLAGILVAAYASWWLLAPVGSTYRRGGLSIVSAFATVLLMLICIPVNQLLGRTGLLLLLGISGLTAVLLGRRARRWGVGA